jgi:hypothetical protein
VVLRLDVEEIELDDVGLVRVWVAAVVSILDSVIDEGESVAEDALGLVVVEVMKKVDANSSVVVVESSVGSG